jgi:hypothetical protein
VGIIATALAVPVLEDGLPGAVKFSVIGRSRAWLW